MEVKLHAAPRGRDVVLEQIRIVGLALRREALVIALVVLAVTVPIVVDIVRHRAASWFDSGEWQVIALIAFLSPFAVWRRDRRFGPGFFWTLPVDRRRLALARVFAGWVWLSIAVIGVLLWNITLAAVSGVAHAETISSLAFAGATAAYLFGSALVLGLRHPLRWLMGAAGVLFLFGFVNNHFAGGPDGPLDGFLTSLGFFSVAEKLATVWPCLSIAAGLVALWVAVSRHRETRRH